VNRTKLLWIAGSVVSAFGLTSGALAADASGCYGGYFTHMEKLQVAPNHAVISVSSYGTGYVTKDPSSPIKGAAGPCVTFIEIIDGKPTGESRCIRTDSQGDKFLIIGKPDGFNSTGMKGTWKVKGLTGKWIGASGGGEWWDAGSGKDSQHSFECFSGSYEVKK